MALDFQKLVSYQLFHEPQLKASLIIDFEVVIYVFWLNILVIFAANKLFSFTV